MRDGCRCRREQACCKSNTAFTPRESHWELPILALLYDRDPHLYRGFINVPLAVEPAITAQPEIPAKAKGKPLFEFRDFLDHST